MMAPPTPFKQMSKKDFLENYYGFLFNTVPLAERCFQYYDEIDKIAQERDFPTALIISTWYREHSCWLSNPDN